MLEMTNKKEKKILEKSTIEFELEQITPMIHFQGEEQGAGIRASDLKPRFDAFLKRYLYDFGNEETKEKIKKYILKQSEGEGDNDKIAYDYKVKVINEGKDNKITFYKDKNKNAYYGSFYGKLEDNKNSYYDRIKVIFITTNKDSEKDSYLQEKIKGLFPVFLAVNGFGIRNNKGYGYFKLKKDNKEKLLKNIQKYRELENQYVKNMKISNKEKGVGIYQLEIENNEIGKIKRVQKLLDEIKSFHQVLKSGINFKDKNNNKNNSNNNGKYIPSFMLKRNEVESGATLEKKALKLFLKKKEYDIRELTKRGDINRNDKFDDLDMKKLYYVRGLLGLAPFYEFRDVKENEKDKYGFTARFNVEIKGVERYASPMKYLPISEKDIIILVDYSKIEELRRKAKTNSVSFSLDEVRGKNNTVSTGLKHHVEIPNEDQYSIHQLFKKSGVIEESLKQYAEEMKKIQQNREWKYSVISDIEIG